ncbi:MAG: DNA polymerase III subunit beta [Phycisphaerales bacterium]
MKVICDRGALLNAINLVAAVVPARTPTPQLGCVKLSAAKSGGVGELTLAGSDGETALQIALTQVDVAQPGQAAIPADKLRQIVSAEEGEPTLTIEVNGEECHIRGSGAHFRIFGYPASEFPPIPDLAAYLAGGVGTEAPRTIFTQTAGALATLIERTSFATARETSRYAINGVLLRRDGKKVEMVATDGRRLALSRGTAGGEKTAAGGSGEPVSCIVPTKALNMVGKLIGDADDPVRVVVTESKVFFAFDHPGSGASTAKGKEKAGSGTPRAVLSSTLVEGTFPPYEDVIPKEQDKKVLADRESLTRAVRKAAVLTNEESRGVRLAFDGKDKRLTLSSRAPEMGEAEINVDLSSYEGENIEISFNPTFISDVLRVVSDQDVIVELKAPNKPGLVRTASGDFMYVVMPVNLPA